MRLLLVTPELFGPWSEGRKNFIRQLASRLEPGMSADLLSTTSPQADCFRNPGGETIYCVRESRIDRLLALPSWVRKTAARGEKPYDAVVHFPFGTFRGGRALINRLLIHAVHAAAESKRTPCITALYSVSDGNLRDLNKTLRIATSPREDWNGLSLRFGIDFEGISVRSCEVAGASRLLFMAGYSQDSKALLENALYERGLVDVLKIGDRLASEGFTLTVAMPLLKMPHLRRRFIRIVGAHSKQLQVDIVAEGAPLQLMRRHSLYVFPYRRNLTSFIPTSVLEAMATGIPVIMTRLEMVRELRGLGDEYCFSAEPGDPDSLLGAILAARNDLPERRRRTQLAAEYVRRVWSIEGSVRDLAQIVERVHSAGVPV